MSRVTISACDICGTNDKGHVKVDNLDLFHSGDDIQICENCKKIIINGEMFNDRLKKFGSKKDGGKQK